MQFQSPLVPGRLIRRYKRFLADVLLDDGMTVTAHCANPGAMLGLVTPGGRVWLSRSDIPTRKLRYSWELVEADFGRGPDLVGINTMLPNRLALEALEAGLVNEISGYPFVRREVRYGRNSRIDLLLSHGEGTDKPVCYLEIKNVHMMRSPGLAEFPDCVTKRGAKHLGELAHVVAGGARAVLLYVIQMQAERLALARDIDPAYAEASAVAKARGVEMLAVACLVTPEGIRVERLVPVEV